MLLSNLKKGRHDLLAELDESRQRIKPDLMGDRLGDLLATYDVARARFTRSTIIHSVEQARAFYGLLNDMWRVAMQMGKLADEQFGEKDDPTGVVTFGCHLIDFAKAAVDVGREQDLVEEGGTEVVRLIESLEAGFPPRPQQPHGQS